MPTRRDYAAPGNRSFTNMFLSARPGRRFAFDAAIRSCASWTSASECWVFVVPSTVVVLGRFILASITSSLVGSMERGYHSFFNHPKRDLQMLQLWHVCKSRTAFPRKP